MPGWYPDPSGAPGRFRFWDGERWSRDTTEDPRTAVTPTRPDNRPGSSGGGRGDKGWLIALAILLALTLVAVVAFLVWGTRDPLGGGGHATEDTNSSSPTIAGWDETSTPTPPPPTNSGGEMVACPKVSKSGNTAQKSGTLTADTLQVDRIAGWGDGGTTFPFSYDEHGQYKTIYSSGFQSWMSNIGVGLLAYEDGFVDPAISAEQVMECFTTSQYYEEFSGRVDLVNEPITINGHQGWRIQAEIHVETTLWPVEGDITDVIVVDLGGNKDHLGLFVSSYTIGDTAIGQLVDAARETLTVLG